MDFNQRIFVVFSWVPAAVNRDLRVLTGVLQAAKFYERYPERMYETTYVSSLDELEAKKSELVHELDEMNVSLVQAHRMGY